MDAILETLRFKYFEEGLRLVSEARSLLSEAEIALPENRRSEELFRIMHTLKGNSAMFEHSEVEEVSRYMESIFDLLRKGKIRMSYDIIELTGNCLDQIEVLLSTGDPLSNNIKKNQMNLISGLKKYAELKDKRFNPIHLLNTIGRLALGSLTILQSSFQDFLPRGFSKNPAESIESVDTSLL